MTRSAKFSVRIGTRPFSGRRYVEDGKVKIEWWPPVGEGAARKRRKRTLGPNTAEERERADDILREALAKASAKADGTAEAPPVLMFGELIRLHLEDARRRRHPRTGLPLRPPTLKNYERYGQLLRAAFGVDRPAASITRKEVKELMRRLRDQDWADGTIARLIDNLMQLYHWAVAEAEILPADPVHGLRRPSRKGQVGAYAPEEGRKLLAALREKLHGSKDWRFRLVAWLTACNGVRAHQAIFLQWADVDLDKAWRVQLPDGSPFELLGVITFRRATTGSKGQDDRTVPMVPPVRDAILEARNLRRDESPWVISNWRDPQRPVTYDGMSEGLAKLERRAGVVHQPGRAFHSFRRAIMTALTEELGPAQAAAWTGDTVGVVVRDYVKPTKEAQGQAAAAVARSVAL